MSRLTYTLIILTVFLSHCILLSAQDFSAMKRPEGIEISEGKKKVLFYQIKPKSLDGKYERAHYIHPLYGLDGTVLTEDFPVDHPHHHGVFWSWHQIIHNGKAIADGWTSENIGWEVSKSRTRRSGNKFLLESEVLWKSVINDSRKAIVREFSKIFIHSATEHYRVIDFDIHLVPLVDGLEIGGSDDAKGYGGFSWRLKLPEDISFMNSDREVTPEVTAVQAGPWLDCVGSFKGKDHPKSGVAVFCHPSNPGHPQPWILRKEKSMQNVAYPGRSPVKLEKNGLRLKYRLIIHNESVTPEDIEKLFRQYSS